MEGTHAEPRGTRSALPQPEPRCVNNTPTPPLGSKEGGYIRNKKYRKTCTHFFFGIKDAHNEQSMEEKTNKTKAKQNNVVNVNSSLKSRKIYLERKVVLPRSL